MLIVCCCVLPHVTQIVTTLRDAMPDNQSTEQLYCLAARTMTALTLRAASQPATNQPLMPGTWVSVYVCCFWFCSVIGYV